MSKYARKTPARGELNGNAKLCRQRVALIREERARFGTSYEGLAYLFGISKRQVRRIVTGESWSEPTQ